MYRLDGDWDLQKKKVCKLVSKRKIRLKRNQERWERRQARFRCPFYPPPFPPSHHCFVSVRSELFWLAFSPSLSVNFGLSFCLSLSLSLSERRMKKKRRKEGEGRPSRNSAIKSVVTVISLSGISWGNPTDGRSLFFFLLLFLVRQ